jgi:cytochrome c553
MPKSISPEKPIMRAAGAALAVACLLTFAHGAAATPPPPSGAASCSGCHPTSPKVQTPVPRLAGRKPEDIVAAMQAFRSGQKSATVMDRIAKGFSDAETRAIADWLSRLGSVTPGPERSEGARGP